MKLSYDQATDSLYIHLVDKPSVDSDEVSYGVVLDFDTDGALVGIDYNMPVKMQILNRWLYYICRLNSYRRLE
jgi:uncharacterized protein YuzE